MSVCSGETTGISLLLPCRTPVLLRACLNHSQRTDSAWATPPSWLSLLSSSRESRFSLMTRAQRLPGQSQAGKQCMVLTVGGWQAPMPTPFVGAVKSGLFASASGPRDTSTVCSPWKVQCYLLQS